MLRNSIFIFSITGLMIGCGGGGGSVANSPPVVSPQVQTLKLYSDGSGVLTAQNTNLSTAGGLSNLIISSSDLIAAREIAAGTLNLVVVPGSVSNFDRFYAVERTGTASNGSSVYIETYGENLNQSGSEYAAMGVATINNRDIAFYSGGSTVSGIPTSGAFTYTGTASVIDSESLEVGGGEFAMTANFNNRSASIAATIPQTSSNAPFFFSANDIVIDNSTGNFSSDNALVGIPNVISESATVSGYFAGTNAPGVHGLVFPNSVDNGRYLGGFYGSR